MSHSSIIFSAFATAPATIVSIFFVLFSAIGAARNRQDKRWEWMLVAWVLTIPASACCSIIVEQVSKLAPYKYDLYVFNFDSIFGQLSFRLGRFAAAHFWLQCELAAVYNLLPCSFPIMYGLYLWWASAEERAYVLRAYILLPLLLVPLYLVYPVCGPYYAFPGFPFNMPLQVTPHPILLDAPPNGMPSGHIAGALVTLYFSRRWKIGLLFSSIFLMLTVIATLESGEHYVFDLIGAIPFAVLVLIAARRPIRFRPTDLEPSVRPNNLETQEASSSSE